MVYRPALPVLEQPIHVIIHEDESHANMYANTTTNRSKTYMYKPIPRIQQFPIVSLMVKLVTIVRFILYEY